MTDVKFVRKSRENSLTLAGACQPAGQNLSTETPGRKKVTATKFGKFGPNT